MQFNQSCTINPLIYNQTFLVQSESAVESPKFPGNEKLRLASLYSTGLLDTSPEERFDRYTRIAQKLYDVPIALISLIDRNRQWFKSFQGLSVSETSREISFCGHAILQEDIFIINDTHQDDRFVDNPLVTDDPMIRFYAGVPLVLASGMKLGTLCIIDNQPRQLDQNDLSELIDLALILMAELSSLELAISDPLTNLLNRRGFSVLAENNLLLANRGSYLINLIFIDLDDFKSVNDIYGHEVGDQILVDFSTLLEGVFRKSDIVARMGGDEFVVLLNNSNLGQAEEMINEFITLVGEYNEDKSSKLRMDFSYGITEYDPSRPSTINEILKESDRKMYQQKASKKAQVYNRIVLNSSEFFRFQNLDKIENEHTRDKKLSSGK